MDDVYKKRTSCAICGNDDLKAVLEYGDVPLAGYFPSKEEIDKEELFNLTILFCPECGLMQTDSIIDADKLFKDYRYMSSIGLSKHFEGVAQQLKDRFKLDSSSKVVEIGSNDGVLQLPFKNLGIEAIGFEPAVNISQIAKDKGLRVINDFFSYEKAVHYLEPDSVDLIVSNNCFAHIDDIHSIVKGIKHALKLNGVFSFEVSYVKNLLEQMQYDNIYHEHIYYYSLNAIKNLFAKHGMVVVDYEFIPIHAGSIRVFVQKTGDPSDKVLSYLEEERKMGLTDWEWFKSFSVKVKNHIKMVKDTITNLKNNGYKIAGYGASGRANMMCNICGLDDSLIDFIVDESPERCGRYIAGKKIPIVSPEVLKQSDAHYVVIFAWNFAKMIMNKYTEYDYEYVMFFPQLQIVKSVDEIKESIGI